MDDDKLEFGSFKSRNAKTGRRAKKDEAEPVAEPAAEEETMTTTEIPQERDKEKLEQRIPETKPTAPPRPSRRVGGWGDESAKSRSTKRRGRRGAAEEFDDERLRPSSGLGNKSDSDDDIPVIPDLEDNQEEDLTVTIAVAPNIAVNRVATYRELDNDLLRHAAFLTLDNEIDLKPLTKGLSTEADVQEEDKPWDWDRLFTEVTSELLAEEAEVAAEVQTTTAA